MKERFINYLEAHRELLIHLGYSEDSVCIQNIDNTIHYFKYYDEDFEWQINDPYYVDKYRLLCDKIKESL